MKRIIDKFSQQPRSLFLLDGLGAILSAFLLGVVLVQLENFFGIPRQALYLLVAFPCVFVLYDGFVYWKVQKNFGAFLQVIVFLNLMYCFLSIGVALYHRSSLTVFGWTYIVLEIMIILLLVVLEWQTMRRWKSAK